MYFSRLTDAPTTGVDEGARQLAAALADADALVVGIGSGVSTSAGFTYSGARFEAYFADFERAYGFHDMYSGGFFPFPNEETRWAYWSRFIFVNRYTKAPRNTYDLLRGIVSGRDYFVLTTNVDHCLQKAGFDKKRLFYTQGDYGLWQCSLPCHDATYDNEEGVRRMVQAQGFSFGDDGSLMPPTDEAPLMRIPAELVPTCPRCGNPMTMNLRSDETFVEDEGWHQASARYSEFLRRHKDIRTLYLELGVGGNTPVIIKYPFWRMTGENGKARYACVNLGEAVCPVEIADQSILANADIHETLAKTAEALR